MDEVIGNFRYMKDDDIGVKAYHQKKSSDHKGRQQDNK